MTTNTIELLDPARHKHLKIDTSLVDVPDNQMNSATVMVGELARLMHEYPVFITKNPNTGQFLLSALLGIESGENLYIQNNVWQARYLPLDILRRPFQAMLAEEGNFSGGRIALDVASPMVQENKGEPLFDSLGQPSPYLERIQQTFGQLMGNMEKTNEVLNQLYKFELLESISLKLDLGGDEPVSMKGLYAINREKLAQLQGEDLETCHREGLLEVCHLIINSGVHVEKLIRWSQEK
ncbi:SapC family protein [Thalassotalea agariperforans]